MKHIIFKSRVALALVVLAMFITAEAFAIDSHSHYFAYGLGQKTCEDYIKFREKKLEALEQKVAELEAQRAGKPESSGN